MTHPNQLEVKHVYGSHGHLVAVRTPKGQVLDYDADFVVKRLIKVQRFAALAKLEVERYRHRARMYRELSTMHAPNVNHHMHHSRYRAIRKTLSGMAVQAQAQAAKMEASHRRYYWMLRRYRQWMHGHYGDAWSKGSDYLEAQTELSYLLAQKHLEMASEAQQLLQEIAGDGKLPVHNHYYTSGAAGGPAGIWHYVSPTAYRYTVDKLKQWQRRSNQSLVDASRLQQRQLLYLSLLGASAKDKNHITWFRIGQSDSEGRVSQSIYGNGLMVTRDYDPASGQLLRIQSGNMVRGNNNDVQHLEYSYDALDNLLRKNDYAYKHNESMGYDRLGRIVSHAVVEGGKTWTHRYSYNAHGDIVSGPAGAYVYGDVGQQRGVLLKVGGKSLSYDANGNVTRAAGGTVIHWNLDNKPTLFTYQGKTTGFRYDGSGSRFLKTVNNVPSLYIGKMYEKNLTSGDEVNHIYFGGYHVASYEKRATGAHQTSYMHRDALGNIDVVTNQHGDILKRYAYDAFGKRSALTSPLNTTGTVAGRKSGVNLLRHSHQIDQWYTWGWYTTPAGQSTSNVAVTQVSTTGGPLGVGYYRVRTRSKGDYAVIGDGLTIKDAKAHGVHFTYSVWIRSANGKSQKLKMKMNMRGNAADQLTAFTITPQWQRIDIAIDASGHGNGAHSESLSVAIGQLQRRVGFDFEIAGAMLIPGRTPGNWHATAGGVDHQGFTYTPPTVDRGYTGHEHFDVGGDPSAGFIHMNGRVYDPNIGRFLSADPHIQAPHTAGSHNRYAYVLNNPYKYTDPSGYFFSSFFQWVGERISGAIKWVDDNKGLITSIAVGIAVGSLTLGWGNMYGMIGYMGSGALAGGASAFSGVLAGDGGFHAAFGAGLRGLVLGGFSAGFARIGAGVASHFGASLTHGATRGMLAEVTGSGFSRGFTSGFIGHYAPVESITEALGYNNVITRTAVAAGLGGTASALNGGSFANGAESAAYVHLYNSESAEAATEYLWPTYHYKITGKFDPNRRHTKTGKISPHRDIDIRNRRGQPVFSIKEGVVSEVNHKGGPSGNYIKVNHDDGIQSSYAHTRPTVNVGERVSIGQKIGITDGSGPGTAPHLHLSVRRNGERIHPCAVLICP